MTSKERDQLAAQTLVAEAPAGRVITYRGETSDMGYFILKGSVAAGYLRDDEYVIARTLQGGDFFGEIAALTGVARTANIITEEESEFLIVPSKVLRRLSQNYAGLKQVFLSAMEERLRTIELPLGTRLDQAMLLELRTNVDQ
jgi:CRP-like cAMP-binding protein